MADVVRMQGKRAELKLRRLVVKAATASTRSAPAAGTTSAIVLSSASLTGTSPTDLAPKTFSCAHERLRFREEADRLEQRLWGGSGTNSRDQSQATTTQL